MTAIVESRPSAPVEADRHYRALDGLRSIAVMSVFAYHLDLSWIPGGFLGVDLFFVLSGFLITGLLWRGRSSEKGLSLRRFYERRFRRLLPALALLLVTVCAWAYWVARPDQIVGLRGQGLGAVFYVANWVFIGQDTSYFAQYQDPSVLMHTWSLAIEEQFYLVFPLLLLALTWKWRRRMMPLVIGAIVLCAASVAWMALAFDEADPFVAYLGTFSRIHELLIGGLASLLVIKCGPWIAARAGRLLDVIAWLAFVGVLAFMFTMPDTSPVYYRGGSLAFSVVAAVLLSALVLRTRGSLSRGLSLAPVVWIGLVSYGIYLWHWPVILWFNSVSTPLNGWVLDVVRIAIAFAVAAASYYVVEMPIRKGRLVKPRAIWIGVPVTMAVLATAVVLSTSKAAPASAAATVNVPVEVPAALMGANSPASPTVMVIGDSVPKELMDTISETAKSRGVNIVPVAFGGCSATGLFQIDEQNGDKPFSFSIDCLKVKRIQSDAIAKFKPKTIVWFSGREKFAVCTSPSKDGCKDAASFFAGNTPEHHAQLEAAMQDTVTRLTAGGAKIVIVLPAERGPTTSGSCIDPTSFGCAQDPAEIASVEWLRGAYQALANSNPGSVSVVDVKPELCPVFDSVTGCETFTRDGVLVRYDGVHLDQSQEQWFVDSLFAKIASLPGNLLSH